jgi:hypothetical protein
MSIALACAWCGIPGCPQDIARRGNYGAFLLEDWPTLKDLVSTLYNHLDVPGTSHHRCNILSSTLPLSDLAPIIDLSLFMHAPPARVFLRGRYCEFSDL